MLRLADPRFCDRATRQPSNQTKPETRLMPPFLTSSSLPPRSEIDQMPKGEPTPPPPPGCASRSRPFTPCRDRARAATESPSSRINKLCVVDLAHVTHYVFYYCVHDSQNKVPTLRPAHSSEAERHPGSPPGEAPVPVPVPATGHLGGLSFVFHLPVETKWSLSLPTDSPLPVNNGANPPGPTTIPAMANLVLTRIDSFPVPSIGRAASSPCPPITSSTTRVCKITPMPTSHFCSLSRRPTRTNKC